MGGDAMLAPELPAELPDDLARSGDDWSADMETLEQHGKLCEVRVAKMGIAAEKDSAFDEGCFGDDKGIVSFRDRDKSLIPQGVANSLNDPVPHWNQIQRLQFPFPKADKREMGGLSLALRIPGLEQESQFLKNRGRHNEPDRGKPLADSLDCVNDRFHPKRQVQQDVGINGYEHGPGNCQHRKRAGGHPQAGRSVRHR